MGGGLQKGLHTPTPLSIRLKTRRVKCPVLQFVRPNPHPLIPRSHGPAPPRMHIYCAEGPIAEGICAVIIVQQVGKYTNQQNHTLLNFSMRMKDIQSSNISNKSLLNNMAPMILIHVIALARILLHLPGLSITYVSSLEVLNYMSVVAVYVWVLFFFF